MKEFEESFIVLIDSLGAQPIIGTILSLTFSALGFTLSVVGNVQIGIADGVKDVFQLLAWSCTIVVSLLTIIGWIKTNKPFKKK